MAEISLFGVPRLLFDDFCPLLIYLDVSVISYTCLDRGFGWLFHSINLVGDDLFRRPSGVTALTV